ncbi:hypothetical protein [Antribacter gilvus]|uniref:hypothetical protein n=1 Tax=Antribacter gilvus TaxID=2304675 RepID=UPI000F7AE833|nr:hypothetical protein [Antribacter gilvus]
MVAHLVRLKLTLLGNTFRRSVWQTIGLIAACLYGLGVVGMLVAAVIATGSYDTEVLGLVVTLGGALATLGWWLIPLFLFGVDATLDPHRFATFGIPLRTLVTGLGVAALISVPGIATLLTGLGVTLAWWRTPALLPLALLGVALGVATCVLGSRALTTALAPLLEARRSREVLAILAMVLLVMIGPMMSWLGGSFGGGGPRSLEGVARTSPEGIRLLADQLAGVVAWTPLGAAWSLPATAHDGAWLAFVGHLAVALGTVALLWLVWERALGRALVRPPVGGGRGAKAKGLGWFGRFPATPTGAVAARSTTYWLRDPRYGSVLAIVPLMPVILWFSGRETDNQLLLILAPIVAWVLGFGLSNDVAYDHTAFALHVATGTSGSADRWGRVIPILCFGVPLVSLFAVLSAVVAGHTALLPAVLGLSLGTLALGLGVSSAVSARLVYPVPKPGESPFKQPQGAAVASMVSQTIALLIVAVLSLPALALSVLAFAQDSPPLAWVALVVSLAVGVGVLVGGVRIGARTYDRRAPELLQQVQSFA